MDRLTSQNLETISYGFGWANFDSNYTTPTYLESIYESFQFKDSQTLQGSSYQGQFNTYPGSGYVFELRGKLSYLNGNLSLLRKMNWIDGQTRAVFAEFSVYNPNINLIMVSTILIEFLEGGSILTSARFDPLNLFDEIGADALFKILLLIICMIFIVYFMFIQIKEAIRREMKEYFGDFWTLIEWSIIISAWMTCIMFLIRLSAAYEVLEFFKKTRGYEFKNLQSINEYNKYLNNALGHCVAFATVKFLKMLRFNKYVSFFGVTLKNCFGELISFSFVFFIVWFAFVQLMFLIYGSEFEDYSSITKAMSTSFSLMIGNGVAGDIGKFKNKIIGPAIFSSYNVIIICFALNIFISIITDSFEMLRLEDTANIENVSFLRHVWKKFEKIPWKSWKRNKEPEITYKDYKDHLSILPNRIETLIALTKMVGS
jgi:polycystin 1L2